VGLFKSSEESIASRVVFRASRLLVVSFGEVCR
jgi:hypothetical protein